VGLKLGDHLGWTAFLEPGLSGGGAELTLLLLKYREFVKVCDVLSLREQLYT